jgi:ABC-type branched-subunit amino acid transport system ATPase component
MMEALLSIVDVTRTFGALRVLDDVSAIVGHGEVLGLIGPNGAGKSTLIRVISGFLRPDRGRVLFDGVNLVGLRPDEICRKGLVQTFQRPRLIYEMSVLENTKMAFRAQPGETLQGVFLRPSVSRRVEREIEEKAQSMLRIVGLAGKEKDPVSTLSYGQLKLLSLTCCLAAEPRMLLLDEPTAGLSPSMLDQVIETISNQPQQGRSVILVEHNMDVVEALCNRVVFLNAGRKVGEGYLNDLRRNEAVVAAYLD